MSIWRNVNAALMLALGLLMATGLTTKSVASTETTLYPFCSSAGCNDGEDPQSPLLKQGNRLYGVTTSGGAHGHGVVFSYNVNNGSYKSSTISAPACSWATARKATRVSGA